MDRPRLRKRVVEDRETTEPPILEFKGEYRFLSNFYPVVVWFEGRRWPTAEHAYQAAKTDSKRWKDQIMDALSPGAAKRLGRRVPLRDDWEREKDQIMLAVLRSKFGENPGLMRLLQATGRRHLEEGNDWNDTYWGVCPPGSGRGENMLGKLLMKVRAENTWER